MESIINFKNSRRITNCSNLCYTNSGIYLLYSLVEFREKIYNTNVINPTELTDTTNNVLYYLKYIFLLMNKILTPTHERYDLNDTHIVCSRDSNGNGNLFYKEIYEPLLKIIIGQDKLSELLSCSQSSNLLDNYINNLIPKKKYNPICPHCTLVNDQVPQCIACNNKLLVVKSDSINILDSLFSSNNENIYVSNYTFNKLQKYAISLYTSGLVEPEKYMMSTSGNLIKYELIGSIYSYQSGGHFWAYIYDKNTNQSLRIDDFGELKNEVAAPLPTYLLYKQIGQLYVDNYPLTQQINNLATISHEINTIGKNRLNELNYKIILKLIKNKINKKVCPVCTLINDSTATNCEVCNSNLN